jgi:hypothetical protein
MGPGTYARKHVGHLSAAQGRFFDAIPITNPGHLWTELTTTSDVAPNRGVLSGLLMSGPQLLLPGTTQLIAVLSVRRNHACSDLIFSRWLCRVLPSSDLGLFVSSATIFFLPLALSLLSLVAFSVSVVPTLAYIHQPPRGFPYPDCRSHFIPALPLVLLHLHLTLLLRLVFISLYPAWPY